MNKGINTDVFSMTKDVMGDKFGNLIETFIKNSDLYVTAVNEGYQARNFLQVEKAAHPLKSSSAMVGFEAFSECAKQTEALSKKSSQEQNSKTNIASVIEALNQEYDIVKSFLKTQLDIEDNATDLIDQSLERLNVMHIDDDAIICKVTQQFLESSGEFNVRNYSSIGEAMTDLHDYVPDILLLDFTLKDMEGVETILHLKSDARLQDTPIILVTGHEKETIQTEMGSFISAYLSKPYSPTTLIEKIKQVCR